MFEHPLGPKQEVWSKSMSKVERSLRLRMSFCGMSNIRELTNITLEARCCGYGKEYKCLIIDVTCPVDNNLILKRNEKLDKYSKLRLEIAIMWGKDTLIVPIIIGALGSIPNDLECNLKKLGIPYNVGTLQNSVLLGTANILRQVISIKQNRLQNSREVGVEKEGSEIKKKRGISS